MGAYGALGGGGRAGARGKGAKTGRYKGWRQPASAKFSRFEKSKGCRTMSDASEADAVAFLRVRCVRYERAELTLLQVIPRTAPLC